MILPTGDIKIDGRRRSATGVENYKEFWYTMVGLAGEGQNFDGNGQYVRFQPGGGDQTVSSGKARAGAATSCSATRSAKPLGTRPAYPGKRPPYKPDVPCYTQQLPDLNGAADRAVGPEQPVGVTLGGRRDRALRGALGDAQGMVTASTRTLPARANGNTWPTSPNMIGT